MKKLNLSIETKKAIEKQRYYSEDQFISDAKTYIKAISENRMICNIARVSSSGMSRVISFHSMEKSHDKNWYLRQYNAFFCAMGYSETKKGFRIGGCGMDMIFHTNYTIINRLKRFGFVVPSGLEQQTPVKI